MKRLKSFFNKLKNYWLPWTLLGSFLVFFAFLALGEFKVWFGLKREVAREDAEIEKREERILELGEEIERLSSPDQLEKEARIKLNLKKEGEEVFQVVGLESISTLENFTEVFDVPPKNEAAIWLNLKSWFKYFLSNEKTSS